MQDFHISIRRLFLITTAVAICTLVAINYWKHNLSSFEQHLRQVELWAENDNRTTPRFISFEFDGLEYAVSNCELTEENGALTIGAECVLQDGFVVYPPITKARDLQDVLRRLRAAKREWDEKLDEKMNKLDRRITR